MSAGRAAALVAGAARLRPVLRDPRGVHEPPPAASARRGQPRRRTATSTPTATSSPTTSPSGRSRVIRSATASQPAPAVLPLPRARRRPRAAAWPRPSTSAATETRTAPAGTRSARRRHERQIELGVIAGTRRCRRATASDGDDVAAVGRAVGDEQSGLRPLHGGVRGDGRRDRPERRPAARRRSRRWASGTTRSSCSCPTTAPAARASRPARRTTTRTSARCAGMSTVDVAADLARLDDIGGAADDDPLPARAGRWRRNTPFRLYKRNTHAGGHQVPCIWHWPAGSLGAGAARRPEPSTGTASTCCRPCSTWPASHPPTERDGDR